VIATGLELNITCIFPFFHMFLHCAFVAGLSILVKHASGTKKIKRDLVTYLVSEPHGGFDRAVSAAYNAIFCHIRSVFISRYMRLAIPPPSRPYFRGLPPLPMRQTTVQADCAYIGGHTLNARCSPLFDFFTVFRPVAAA